MTESINANTPAAPGKRPSRFLGRYLIKHRFQWKFSLSIFIFLATACLIIWGINNYYIQHMIKVGLVENEQAQQVLDLMNRIIAQTSFIALAVALGLALFFSHFIAGPIYRFERVLEQIRDGDLNLFVRLRKNDEFKETAELFNQALSSLRRRIQKERDDFHVVTVRIKEIVERLRQRSHHEEADELDALLKEIEKLPPHIKI